MAEQHLDLDLLEGVSRGEELNPTASAHLESCEACRGEVECLMEIERASTPTCSLEGGQILTLRRERHKRAIGRWGAVASIALVLSLFAFGFPLEQDASSEARSLSVAWLASQQAEDGAWKVEDWGGKTRFRVGISSMALLAILREPDHDRIVVERGLKFLLKEQGEDGAIGERFLGDLYNHSLATLVLRKAHESSYKVPEKALSSATFFLSNQRQMQGKWGYRRSLAPERNLSAWASRAMDEAMSGAAEDLGAAMASSSETFEEVRREHLLKAPDPMSAYLEGLALNKDEERAWKKNLVALQEQKGALAGSWPVDDRWGRVGGRVFTTGMAVLALE